LLFIATAAVTGYLFTRPTVSYNDTELYIKKIYTKEMVVSLKNVRSFFENPLSVNKGTAIYTIEYNGDTSVKFAANYSSDNIRNFKALLKKANPHAEII
jgi:hypothetical protein